MCYIDKVSSQNVGSEEEIDTLPVDAEPDEDAFEGWENEELEENRINRQARVKTDANQENRSPSPDPNLGPL
ncbi:hypothetical protein Pcinc_034163 [Petrolisthes cinctipes]|uniref:Uncharacterized protein n=1 Tax=Petrolisthes cinctipes TaxID=88211 RepID=A0AAE1EQS0_PETCI|nr:hypothetical protein Pcinc_034163 [Petrolisthes cinctipes]